MNELEAGWSTSYTASQTVAFRAAFKVLEDLEMPLFYRAAFADEGLPPPSQVCIDITRLDEEPIKLTEFSWSFGSDDTRREATVVFTFPNHVLQIWMMLIKVDGRWTVKRADWNEAFSYSQGSYYFTPAIHVFCPMDMSHFDERLNGHHSPRLNMPFDSQSSCPVCGHRLHEEIEKQ